MHTTYLMRQREEETNPAEMPDCSEAELVARARNEDTAAYGALVARFQKRIYGLVYNMTSNREDTEDVVQDVFIKAYASLPRFQGKSSFYTWVYRIAVNTSINFVKKRKRRTGLSLDEMDHGVERTENYLELSSRESPFRDTSLNELQQKLNEALQTLSENHRLVVVMHDIQGLPHEEIGKILDVSAGTVRSRLFYARQRLQVELSEFKP